MILPGGKHSTQDNCVRCDAAPAAAPEHDGFHACAQTGPALLHIHPQHHTGRGGPHTGKKPQPVGIDNRMFSCMFQNLGS